MANYIPPTLDWVREQVELYESSGGTKGTTLRDTGLPCILVTHKGNRTGGIRKIPLMRVKVGDGYVLVGSIVVHDIRSIVEHVSSGREHHRRRSCRSRRTAPLN